MEITISNFNKQKSYTTQKQANNALNFATLSQKETCPLQSIKKSSSEKNPTEVRTEIICKWANFLDEK
jgi:hypothetical protein